MTALMARRVLDTANNENLIWQAPIAYKRDGSKIGVIHCHGYGGTDLEAVDAPTSGESWYKAPAAAAEAGYPVVVPHLGGPSTGGNDLSITRVGQANTFLQSKVGAKSGKVFLSATSGGFLAAANWARQNPTQVAGILGYVFSPDLAWLHSNPALTSIIDSAYGGSSAYNAALPTHNPAQYATADLAGIPMLLVYSTDEPPSVPPHGSAIQASFASAMGAVSPVTAVTQVGGHSLANLDVSVIGEFLGAHA